MECFASAGEKPIHLLLWEVDERENHSPSLLLVLAMFALSEGLRVSLIVACHMLNRRQGHMDNK